MLKKKHNWFWDWDISINKIYLWIKINKIRVLLFLLNFIILMSFSSEFMFTLLIESLRLGICTLGRPIKVKYHLFLTSADILLHLKTSERWNMISFYHELTLNLFFHAIKNSSRDLPGSPMARTLCFHCREYGFDPWSGN